MAVLKVFLRSEYNYDMNEASDESALTCRDPSKTQQSQAEEADINTIVKRFGITGRLPENVRVPLNSDFEDAFDFQASMNALVEAERSFMKMPADIRGRFQNDPAKFVDFCSDDANLEEMTRMGLAVKKADPPIVPPMRVEVVNPTPPEVKP